MFIENKIWKQEVLKKCGGGGGGSNSVSWAPVEFFFSHYHRFYLVNILLHFYFRVQVPLNYPCEIQFWISREILKTVITYKTILF